MRLTLLHGLYFFVYSPLEFDMFKCKYYSKIFLNFNFSESIISNDEKYMDKVELELQSLTMRLSSELYV